MSEERVLSLPFYYGQEAEQYSFYRIPKILFTEPVFCTLTSDARLLYGILLDRMQLSMRNRWVDEAGRVYIYYSIKAIMRDMGCANKKAGAMLQELEDIGLISRHRTGQGKPDKIFVHKCFVAGVSFEHFQTCENDISGNADFTFQEMSKIHGNNTEKNKTEKSETERIFPSGERLWEETGYHTARQYFEDRLDYETLIFDFPYQRGQIDEIIELLTDTICSTGEKIRVIGENKPAAVVKSRLMKLNGQHVRYVLECMGENTMKIHNIRQYLLAMLYNAPVTMHTYYAAKVNCDLYGRRE